MSTQFQKTKGEVLLEFLKVLNEGYNTPDTNKNSNNSTGSVRKSNIFIPAIMLTVNEILKYYQINNISIEDFYTKGAEKQVLKIIRKIKNEQ